MSICISDYMAWEFEAEQEVKDWMQEIGSLDAGPSLIPLTEEDWTDLEAAVIIRRMVKRTAYSAK